MTKFNKLITAILCCVAIILGSAVFAHAESTAQTAISAASSVKEGEEFTVTVKFTSSVGMGSVDAILKYDSGIITFVSGQDASGSSGSIRLSKWSQNQSSGDKTFTFSLKFKAKSAGSCSISVSDIELTDYDFLPMIVNSANTTVKVNADIPLSSNNYLSGIKLSSGSLSPKFTKKTLSYTVNVPNETDTMRITATCEDSKAKSSVSGTASLKVGTNTRKITVTAEDGSQRVYTVKIVRAAAEGESMPPESSQVESNVPPVESESPVNITVYIDGNEMTIVENFETVVIPEGFAETVCTVNGSQVMAVTNSTNAVVMLYLTDSEDNGAFYIYDTAEISYMPYRTLTVGANTYISLSKPRGLAIPSGFSAADLTIDEQVYSAWVNDEDSTFYMMYLCNVNGVPALYMYDSAEGTMMRYLNIESSHIGGNDQAVGIDTPVPATKNIWFYVSIILALMIIGLNVIVIVLIVKCSKSKDIVNISESYDEFGFNESDFAPIEQAYADHKSANSADAPPENDAQTSDVSNSPVIAPESSGDDDPTSFGDDFIIR